MLKIVAIKLNAVSNSRKSGIYSSNRPQMLYNTIHIQEYKRLAFLHGSVRRYKPLRSSTNCGCGHLMMQLLAFT